MHEIIATEDGSHTLFVPELDEHYHSVHGAIQESCHIFIKAGMDHVLTNRTTPVTDRNPLHILEAGFGTGLNAYLSLIHCHQLGRPAIYHTLEKYPLSAEEIRILNYPVQTGFDRKDLFYTLHSCPWEEEVDVTPLFRFCKHRTDFRDIDFKDRFDLIYFDAFNPDVQPHLWTEEIFKAFADALHPKGVLVTYCVKGIVKQALRATGFSLERLPGPPGKREMLRAVKTITLP